MFLLVSFQEEGGQFISILTFADIRYEDAGKYSCSDQATSVTVSQLIYLIGQCEGQNGYGRCWLGVSSLVDDPSSYGLFCCLY